jgi:hypothetical protein
MVVSVAVVEVDVCVAVVLLSVLVADDWVTVVDE